MLAAHAVLQHGHGTSMEKAGRVVRNRFSPNVKRTKSEARGSGLLLLGLVTISSTIRRQRETCLD